MFEPRPLTATVDRRRLIEVLDIVADAADALETVHGDPDLIRALRYAINEVASDLEAADLVGAIDTADDPVRALQLQRSELERAHVEERERHHAGLASFGAAVPVTCHHCGAPLRTRFVGTGWVHPRSDCPYAKNPRPADRRASAELVVWVAPDHEPVVRRFGGDLMVSLARPDGPTGWREARRRRAPCGGATVGHPALLGIGRALAAAERDENEYGEPLNETG